MLFPPLPPLHLCNKKHINVTVQHCNTLRIYWPSSRISMHVWMKFKAFFDELFMQLRSLSCWNSRQMRRAAEQRYSLRNATDADMFFKLHRILGLYFGWDLQVRRIQTLISQRQTPSYAALNSCSTPPRTRAWKR